MDNDPPLEYMLSEPAGPAAGRDELHAIVARSGQRRTRLAAAGMIGTLAIGAIAGWAASSRRATRTTSLAAGGSTTTIPALREAVRGAAGGGIAFDGNGGPAMTKKFVRTTTDGVSIRGYEWDGSKGMSPSCGVFLGFQAEVSTADIVGVGSAFVGSSNTAPFTSISPMTLGDIEKAPVRVVTVKTGAGVAQVRVTFADGKTDQMAPVDGWSVLASKLPAANAGKEENDTVQALDSSGQVVATQSTYQAPPAKPIVPDTAVVPKPLLPPVITGPGSTKSGGPQSTTIVPPPNAGGNTSTFSSPPSGPVPCAVPAPVPVKPGDTGPATAIPTPNVTPATAAR